METKTKKLFQNSLIFGIANFGTKLLSFIMVVFYTYIFTTEEYGIVDLIVTAITLIVPVISLYIHDGLMRFVMDKDYDNKKVLSTVINILNIIFSVVLIISIVLILLLNLESWYYIFVFVIFSQCYYNVLGQFVRGTNKIKEFAIGGIINSLILLISNVVFLFVFHLSIVGYLLSMLLSYIFACVYYIKKSDIIDNYSIKLIDKKYLKDILKYCIPLIPNSIMWWIVNMSDRYMILYIIGKTANGLYAVANKVPSLLSLVANIFFQAWQLTVIEEYESEDKEIYFSKVFNYFIIALSIVNVLILIVVKPLIILFLSEEFIISWRYVPFLLLSAIFSSFAGFFGTYYAMSKNTKGAMISTVISAVFNIILNMTLIPKLGMNGATLATMLSMMLLFVIRAIDTRKFVKMNYDFKLIFLLVIVTVMQIILYYSNSIYGYLGQLICIILIFIFVRNNFKDIIKFMKDVKKIKNKNKSNEI